MTLRDRASAENQNSMSKYSCTWKDGLEKVVHQ